MPFPAASTSAAGKCLTTGPTDVCKTPTPAGPTPIPYPNIGMTSDGSGSSKVKICSKQTLRKGDKLSKSMGDNAGTAGGGVKSSKFMGPVVFKDGCGKVKAEGKAVAYATVMTEHNDGNIVGAHAVPSQTKVTVIGPPGPDAAGASAGGAGPASPSSAGGAGGPGAPTDPVSDMKGLDDCSPTMQAQLDDLRSKGGSVAYGPPGGGDRCNPGPPPRIQIDPSHAGNPKMVAQLVAHELGHFAHPNPPPSAFIMPGTKASQFRQSYTLMALRGEAWAVLNNNKIRNEIKNNPKPGCGGDIGINGPATNPSLDSVANGPLGDQQKLDTLALLWGRHSTVSGGAGTTHLRYYMQWAWDFTKSQPHKFLPG